MTAITAPTIMRRGADLARDRASRAAKAPSATSRPTITRPIAPRESGCQVVAGCHLELDLDLAGQRRLELADPLVQRPQSLDRRSGGPAAELGDGWLEASAVDLGGDVDRLSEALVALAAASARSAVIRSAWRAFSSMLRRSASAVSGLGPPLARVRQRVAVALELGERQLALLERPPWPARRPARRP